MLKLNSHDLCKFLCHPLNYDIPNRSLRILTNPYGWRMIIDYNGFRAQDVSKHRKIAHVTFGHVARILGKMEKKYFIMVPNFRSVKTPRTVQWVLHSPGGWAQVYYCFPDSLRIGLCRRRPPLLLAPARLLLTPARPPESR